MTDEIKAISVGLRVDLSQLDADLQSARLKAQNAAAKQYKLNFSVGAIDLSVAEREIKRLLAGKIVVTPTINVSRATVRELRAALVTSLGKPIPLSLSLSDAEIGRIQKKLATGLGSTPVSGVGSGGGRGGPVTAVGTALTPHERAVSTDISTKVAKAIKATPVAPVVASAPAGAIAAAYVPPPPPIAAPVATKPVKTTARVVSAAPSVTVAPVAAKGRRVDVRVDPDDGLTHKYDAATGADLGPAGAKGRYAAIRRSSEVPNRRLTIDRNRGRAEEVDPNAPPYTIGLGSPLTAEEQEAADKRGRGVRGASRSGARQRNEPVLTEKRKLDIDTMQRAADAENSTRRNVEIGAPALGSKAFFGSHRGGRAHRQLVSQVQFNRFDPALGQAFSALSSGELGEARELLKGLSGRLAGATPRERRRYFKLFKNTEKVKPELLEQHAALGALFHEINVEGAKMQLSRADEALAAFPKPKGRKANWPDELAEQHDTLLAQRRLANQALTQTVEGVPSGRQGRAPKVPDTGPKESIGGPRKGVSAAIRALNEGRMTREEFQLKFPGLSGRAGGGRVRGTAYERMQAFLDDWDTKNPIPNEELLSPGHQEWWGRRAGARRSFMESLKDAEVPGWRERRQAWQEWERGDPRPGQQRQQVQGRVEKLRAMATQETQSPNEAAIARRMLRERGVPGYVGGGRVLQGGGLLARQKAHEAVEQAKKGYLVNERHEEAFIGDSGTAEHIKGGPQIYVPPENGKIVPFVPPWLRNLQAKDMTERAAGGPVYGGKLAAEPDSGVVGTKRFRVGVPGEREAIAGGLLGKAGGVQRVFVVNWPSVGAGGITSVPHGGSVAAGPLRFESDKDASKFAKDLGGRIGKELKELLGGTRPVKPEAPEAETSVPTKLSASERFEAKLAASGSETAAGLRQRILSTRAAVSEVQQQIPVRSLAPAVGQIAATAFGGRGEAQARLSRANDLTAQATKAAGLYVGELEKLNKIETQINQTENPEKKQLLTDALNDQADATEKALKNAAGLADKAEGAAKAADSLGLKTRVLAANTLGIIGGTLLFSATLGVAQGAIEGIGKLIGPVVERLTGFKNVTGDTTKVLADQTRAAGGAVESTVALAAANAGLSENAAKTITPLLAQRAAIEEGNTALQDSLKLVHSAIEIRRQAAQSGGNAGIGTATGGFFEIGALGGVPSTQEQVVNELKPALPTASEFAANKNATDYIAQNPNTGSLADQLLNVYGKNQYGGPATNFGAAAQVSSEFTKKLAESATYLDTFQGALDKGGKQFVLDAQKLGESDDQLATRQADAAKAAQAFSQAGLLDTAKLLRDTNLVIRDTNGQAIKTADQARQFYLDINKGFQTPDVGLLIKSLSDRIIPAQLSQFRAEGVLQRQFQPGRAAFQQLAAPTAGLTGGPAFSAGLVGVDKLTGKTDTAAQQAANKYQTLVGGAVKDVNALIAQGRDDLVNLVPPELRTEFTGLLSQIEATGQAISKIQTGLQQDQANLAIAEYNNQLRIARRSLKDAKDIQSGLAGATKDTLGGLEGQNIVLQRQLQLLGFELQQRQINFRVATAGFVAPGTTPEERAARIEEAKKEAEYAQKQLDLQRQIAANQNKAVTISVGRDVTDLINQIALLQQGRTLTINTAAANKALDILNKKQQLLVENAGTYIEEGTKIVTAAVQAASQIQSQTGKGFSYILGQTAEAWGIFGQQAKRILDALRGTAPTTAPRHVGLGGQASGIMFDTTGTTNLTVGEAGKETVAVLRNPRQMTFGQLMSNTKEISQARLAQQAGVGAASGGALHITVVVTGNTISKDTDLGELAEIIAEAAARKAEERLMHKAALLNGRRG